MLAQTSNVGNLETALTESVDETIRSLFSQQVVESFHANLKEKRSVNWEDLANQLPTLCIVLEKYFGLGSRTIERRIAQTLYAKYGLEFQRNEAFRLTDYVNNASSKLQPPPPSPSPEPTNVNLPLKDDFNQLLVESVKEAIEEQLGKEQAKLAFRFLERDVTFEKLPNQLPTFYIALKKNFGADTGKIENAIARKLYQKLSLQFTENPDTELARYVESAFIKVSQREQSGFSSASAK